MAMAPFAFLDTPFDPDFPVYTRANAGEILPDPITPLSWSLIGPGLEEGFRISFCDDLGLVPRPDPSRPYQLVGRMAARFHLNLSVMRADASDRPEDGDDADATGSEPDDALEGPAVEEVRAYRPHSRDRLHRFKAPPALGRTLAGIGRRVNRDRGAVDDLGTRIDEALAGDATAAELIHLARRSMHLFGRVLGTHVTCRGLSAPLLDQALAALARSEIEGADALGHLSSIPDLETAQPARRLAALATTIAPGSPLTDLLAQGSYDALAAADDARSVPGADRVRTEVDAFLAEFGHRGVGHVDPMRPTWSERPDDVVVLLARQRSEALPPPDAPASDPGRLARPILAAARSALARAERTEDNVTRASHNLRRVLRGLEDGLGRNLPDGSFPMLTLAELEIAAHGGALPADAELERREKDFDAAAALAPAEWSDGALRLEPALDGDPDAPLDGTAASPGIGRGPVRILDDPYQAFAAGDVLVCHVSDPAWTPLFPPAAAVVTEVGGVLSHAAIVARDLGTPAVVNARRATSALRTGQIVEVDGSSGLVRVVEDP